MEKQAFNPYLPGWEYIPDAEPHIYGDRLYIYGSHDKFNGEKFCMNDYVCWSAHISDLSNWRYEGVIYRKDQDPRNSGHSYCLYAPDVTIGLDGRYYLYYALENVGLISVAVCDTPAGAYTYYGDVRYSSGTPVGENAGDVFQFDPGVYIDDDERIFLYSGFSPKIDCSDAVLKEYLEKAGAESRTEEMRRWGTKRLEGAYVFELGRDMLTVKHGPELMIRGFLGGTEPGFEGHEFFEAASMRKIRGRYYFIYSSVNGHELCYATSDKPDRGFGFGGTIVSIGDVCLNGRTPENAINYLGNTHGSLVEINGKWYVFYHRQTNRHQYSRQACAEPIVIADDGTIDQVEVTSCGLNNGPLAGKGLYPARIACMLAGKEPSPYSHMHLASVNPQENPAYPYFTQDGEDCEHGEYGDTQHIANFRDGAIAGIKYFAFSDTSRITIRVRGNACGRVVVSTAIDGVPSGGKLSLGKPVAGISIKLLHSNEWTDFSAEFSATDGIHPLYFTYEGEGAIDILSLQLD